MGVPSFFKWLLEKYPKTVVYCKEAPEVSRPGGLAQVDSSAPNPNGEEFDNLYLDMNGG